MTYLISKICVAELLSKLESSEVNVCVIDFPIDSHYIVYENNPLREILPARLKNIVKLEEESNKEKIPSDDQLRSTREKYMQFLTLGLPSIPKIVRQQTQDVNIVNAEDVTIMQTRFILSTVVLN